jgi:anthranilate synthase component 1
MGRGFLLPENSDLRMVMYTPTLEQVKELAKEGNLIPVYQEINADLETPVTAYMKVAKGPYSFLLESIEGGERLARYSFIGTEPSKVIRTGPNKPDGAVDPLRLVEKALSKFKPVSVPGLPRFNGGQVGFLAYDAVHYFEPRVPAPASNPLNLPESTFMLADTLLVFDHLRQKIQVVSHVHVRGDIEAAYNKATKRIDRLVKRLERPLKRPKRVAKGTEAETQDASSKVTVPYTSNRSYEDYDEIVRKSREYIIAGDIIQVVPSQRLARPTEAAPLDLYRALRGSNPSPYMFFLELDDFHIIGASPELLVRVEDGLMLNFPLAGTRPRGKTPEQDEALAEELLNNEKERAEHIMLVDLGRNDVGRVCIPGSVEVTDLMRIVRYSHVMHLESEVHGQLRPDRTIYDALRSCLPAGTLSGAPKVRAMEIISELEGEARGAYGGAVGYFSFSGNMDTAITIRTMILKDGVAYIQAGGGIVYDSEPEAEYQETFQKAGALLNAINIAEQQG